MKQSLLNRVPWRALMAAWLVLITGSLVADGLKGKALFEHWWPALTQYQWLITLGVVVLFIAASVWLYHQRQAFSLARSLSRHLCEPHASLILFVSTPNLTPSGTASLFPLQLRNDRGPTVELHGKSLAEDIKALDAIRWNWQQLLRAIVPHATTLQRLHLIGSPGANGSFAHLGLCQGLLQAYLPGVSLVQVDEPVDFEDFNVLVQCMRRIIEQEKQHGMQERDIIIDVTGGFKTTSIAGASITFNSQVTFQYVQTSPPNEVYAYDVVYQPPFSSD
jgi:hypothetical protein